MDAFIALSAVGATLWWIGLAVLVVIVLPAVLLVALTLVRTIAEIERYAKDISAHGAGLADAVGNAAALEATPGLAAEVGAQLRDYVGAWQSREDAT